MKIYPALPPLRAPVRISNFTFVILNFAFRLAAFLHRLARFISFVARRNPPPLPPPVQLALDLDQVTESGLRLREALPVRSAEYWLQLGAPDVALQELETLPEPVRQHHWPRRVRFAARLQLTQTS